MGNVVTPGIRFWLPRLLNLVDTHLILNFWMHLCKQVLSRWKGFLRCLKVKNYIKLNLNEIIEIKVNYTTWSTFGKSAFTQGSSVVTKIMISSLQNLLNSLKHSFALRWLNENRWKTKLEFKNLAILLAGNLLSTK